MAGEGRCNEHGVQAWLDPVADVGVPLTPKETYKTMGGSVPDSLQTLAGIQGRVFEEICGDDPGAAEQALGLLTAYSPDAKESEKLQRALRSRENLLAEVGDDLADIIVHEGTKDLAVQLRRSTRPQRS